MERTISLPSPAPSDDRASLLRCASWVPFDPAALDGSIGARFAAQVRRHGRRPAVHWAGQSWSYDRLAARAWRIARAILDRRGDREEPAALLLPPGPELIAAVLGVLTAGKAYVALDPAHTPERNRSVLADCAPALLLTCAATRAGAVGRLATDRLLDLDDLDGDSAADPALDLPPDRLACIYYTSGSTGRPKGVADSHRNVLHNILRYTDSLGIGCADRLILLQSCAYSGAVSSLFAALLNGACCHPLDLAAVGIQGLARAIAAERLTMLHAVPAIFRALAATEADLSSLRVIRLEGDLAGRRDAQTFQRRFRRPCMLVNGLGATETGLTCQYFLAADGTLPAGGLPVGHATTDVELALLGEDGREVAPGAIGEVEVRSRYLALGYWHDPARTAERFTGEPGGVRRYRSGDLGRRAADGALELLGRKDLLVKLRGAWVDPAAIERTLLAVPGVKDAAVSVRETPGGRAELTAHLVPVAAPPPDPAELRAALLAGAPELPVPTRWLWLAALPQDANGKIDRSRLPAAAGPPADTGAHGVVAACWCEILGSDAAHPDRTFSQAGGDSFAAIELALLLEQRLSCAVPPDLIAPHTTLAQLARQLSRPGGTACVRLLADGRPGPPLVLFHGVHGHLLAYEALVGRISPARPVYGVAASGLDAAAAPSDIASLVAHYANELRPFLGDGPCTVAGNCFGGVLALETARLLRAAGTAVAPAVLIDTAFPTTLRHRLAGHAAALLSGEPGRSPSHETLPPGRAAMAARMAGWLGKRLRRRPASDLAAMLERAGWSHRPRPDGDRAVLICVGAVTNQRGWERVTRGGIETHLLPVRATAHRHDPVILEPYTDDIASVLRGL